MSKAKPAAKAESAPKEKNFMVLIKNPNGATEGVGTLTISARAVDRKAAQAKVLAYVHEKYGKHYRLHDTETEKPL